MSDGGGDEGGGKGGGGGKGSDDNKPSSGFSPTGQGVSAPTNADLITAPPSALPLFNSSTDISASDGSTLPGSSVGSKPTSGDSANANTANLNTPSGLTAPAAGGVGAASVAPVAASVGGTPSDLTTDLSARSNTGGAPNFPGGNVPLPPAKPSIPGQDNSLDNLAATGTTSGATTKPVDLLSPDQLGQPSSTATASPSTAKSTSDKSGGLLDSLGVKNPIGTALSAGGLAYAVSQGQSANAKQAGQLAPGQLEAVQSYLKSAQDAAAATGPNATAQSENAKQLYQQGQNLVQYLQTGTLPPDAQASLDQATASAKAAIKSRYASQGLNTDPNQNSVLNQELQQVDQQAIASKSQLEQQYQAAGAQLIQASQSAAAEAESISNNITAAGTAAAGLSSDLYKTLIGIDQTSQAQIGAAIANFAKSVSGGGASGSGTTINVGSK